ncbi:MAG: MFS transporter [Mesorhizobium sp.]|nr:MAG: MFS transporter [Mesorhizobium sp.]TIQ04877.1 MAG: MFS transporter [Mesorhizobium sp.]TIR53695.1 MAG: MFS transporter [Mesorhizobium sp.]TJV96709.1 MAG: MFS transporter [Mesorhizobium sp.]
MRLVSLNLRCNRRAAAGCSRTAAMAVPRTLFPDPGDYGRAMATWGVSVLGAILGFVVSGILTARRQRRANRRVSTGAAAPWTYSRRKNASKRPGTDRLGTILPVSRLRMRKGLLYGIIAR